MAALGLLSFVFVVDARLVRHEAPVDQEAHLDGPVLHDFLCMWIGPLMVYELLAVVRVKVSESTHFCAHAEA